MEWCVAFLVAFSPIILRAILTSTEDVCLTSLGSSSLYVKCNAFILELSLFRHGVQVGSC